MSLSLDQVRPSPSLARLELAAGELEATQAKLNGIFSLIEEMQAVDTDGVEPMSHPRARPAPAPRPVTEPTAGRLPGRRAADRRPGSTWCRRSSDNPPEPRPAPGCARPTPPSSPSASPIDLQPQDIAAALRAKTVSAVELATDSLARIKARDRQINAFVTVDRDGAWPPPAPTPRIAGGSAGPLTGIPLAHKDVFCTEGVLTTCGSKMLAQLHQPLRRPRGQPAQAAGAVMVGKTNMDEFAMGSSTRLPLRPHPQPWDTTKVPGGSSGGSGRWRRAHGADRHRHRHRRLGAPAGRPCAASPASSRPTGGVALRHDRLRLVAGPGRRLRPLGRRLRAAAVRHDGPTRATPPAWSAATGDCSRRPPASPRRPAHRPAQRVLRRGHADDVRAAVDAAIAEYRAARRHHRRGQPAQRRGWRSRPTT